MGGRERVEVIDDGRLLMSCRCPILHIDPGAQVGLPLVSIDMRACSRTPIVWSRPAPSSCWWRPAR